MIDVAGPALLAAAARSHFAVTPIPRPGHYAGVVAEIRERGIVSAETRQRLAAESFALVAAYHAEIAAYLNRISGDAFPPHVAMVLEKVSDLPYGENPHQGGRLLPRDHAPQRHARRRRAPRWAAALLQRPPRPRRRVPDRDRLHRAHRRRRPRTPTRSGSPRPTSSSRRTGGRSRSIPSPRSGASSGSTGRSTGRPRVRSSSTTSRGSSRRRTPTRRSPSSVRAPSSRSSPSRRTPSTGRPTTGSPPGLQAHLRRGARRDRATTTATSTGARSAS